MDTRAGAGSHEAGEEAGNGGVRLYGIFDTWGADLEQRRVIARQLTPGGDTGSAWFLGGSGAGKSSLAAAVARELADRQCWPLLIVDTEETMGDAFPAVPVAHSVGDAARLLWTDGSHCRWMPNDPDELERMAELARQLRRVVLLVDESADYLHSGTRTRSRVLKLIRTHRHSEVWLLFTTQHPSGDVPQAAFGGGPLLYVFQTSVPAALEQLERQWGVPAFLPQRLAAGQCVVVETGLTTQLPPAARALRLGTVPC